MSKVTDLIKNKDHLSFSYEVTPDVSKEEIDGLEVEPIFFSITWHAKSHKCRDLNIEPLRMASYLKSKQKHVVLHMSCDMMKIDYLRELLIVLREKNICNLFLILGESYDPKSSDFQNTSQLIKFIREHSGNYFCIGVAGYPGCSDHKLLHMKEKVESGADYIITQAFFDINTFKMFKERCENINIRVPILPGVFPFDSFKQLDGFIKLCKIKVSNDLLEYVQNIGHSNKSCLQVVKLLIQELNTGCHSTHIHFFTLNKLQRISEFIQENLIKS